MLALGAQLALEFVTGIHLVLQRQELHRVVDAFQLAAGHRQIARLFRAAGQQYRIELGLQLFRRDRFLGPIGDLGALAHRLLRSTHDDTGAKHHALGLHLLNAPVDMRLLHLEVGNPIAQQTADAIVLLE